MRWVVVLALAFTASPARAEDTFEAKAAGAVRIRKADGLVWALTATCERGDDTQRRQCRRVRDLRTAELRGATLVVDADPKSFALGEYSAAKRSAPIVLSGCVRCGGVEVEGKTWHVVGMKPGSPPPKIVGGALDAGNLHDNVRTFPDEAAAKAFARAAERVRVQLIARLGAKPKLVVDGKQVLALEVLGYRAFSACDGEIVCASPRSGPAQGDRSQCGAAGAAAGAAGEVDQLTPAMIKAALQPVVDAAQACHAKHGQAGKSKLRITVGGDGTISAYEHEGDFANTPTGACIDAAAKRVTFPRSKRDKTTFGYPIKLP